MKSKKNERDKRMMRKDQIDSPSVDEGSCGGSVAGVGGRILKKGPWTSAEDAILVNYVKKHGQGNWNAVQKHSGLSRCGKSCRLRWANHLRPNLKRGAITPEEERLIIDLHSKIGNKWARMAALLPGRTDNEIKNYWNTRIKRHQRAGLSLYPTEMCCDTTNENLQIEDAREFGSIDKQHNEAFHGNTHDIFLDSICHDLKVDQGLLSYASPFPTWNHFKQLHGSETLLPGLHGCLPGGFPTLQQFSTGPAEMIPRSFVSTYPYDPDPINKNHALSNGNFSTSRPFTGPVKLELPSIQHIETDVSSWFACPSTTSPEVVDTRIQVQSDCDSPRNSGLLEVVLHEARGLRITRNHSSEKILTNDPITPPISGISFDEFPASKVASGEIDAPGRPDFLRPDTLLGSDWLDESSRGAKEHSMLNDVAAFLGDDLCDEYKSMPSGAASSKASHGLGLESYPWNNMPRVYQMPEIPRESVSGTPLFKICSSLGDGQ